MIIYPPIWIGWRADVVLPLERPRSLVVWQYLRMLRPYGVIAGVFSIDAALENRWNPQPGSTLAIVLKFTVIANLILLWTAASLLLDHFEFVRLLRYSNEAGTVTVRFSSASLAQRARGVLVPPHEVELPHPTTQETPIRGNFGQQSLALRLGRAFRGALRRIRVIP